jgi:hypothetical protein
MIHEVDEALNGLLAEDILAATGAEVVFDAPTRAWAAGRSSPTVNVFFFEIREDLSRRRVGRTGRSDERGATVAFDDPPQWYQLSYLVTAWTRRPQDEHRLLAALLAGIVARPVLPPERLTGSLAALGLPIPLDVALPPEGKRGLADVWSALGGELKPALDLMVTAPLVLPGYAAAPPVRDLSIRLKDATEDPERGPSSETADRGAPVSGQRPEQDRRDEQRRLRYDDDGDTAGTGAASAVGARRARGAASGRPPEGPVRR